MSGRMSERRKAAQQQAVKQKGPSKRLLRMFDSEIGKRIMWIPSGKKPLRGPKVGRNEPCPCGSGLKYKTCCLGRVR